MVKISSVIFIQNLIKKTRYMFQGVKLKKIILAAIVFFLISIEIGLPGAGNSFANFNIVDSVTIPILATSADMSEGITGNLTLSLLDDEHMLIFADNIIIDEKTYLAAQHAVEFAETYTGKKAGLLIIYNLPAQAVSAEALAQLLQQVQ